MPRRKHRPKDVDQAAPALDASRESDSAELEAWRTAEAHLRALRAETQIRAPKVITALLTQIDEPARYLVSYRLLGPFSIVWDQTQAAFVWIDGPRAGEVVGDRTDLTKTVRALAEVVHAPVRQM